MYKKFNFMWEVSISCFSIRSSYTWGLPMNSKSFHGKLLCRECLSTYGNNQLSHIRNFYCRTWQVSNPLNYFLIEKIVKNNIFISSHKPPLCISPILIIISRLLFLKMEWILRSAHNIKGKRTHISRDFNWNSLS